MKDHGSLVSTSSLSPAQQQSRRSGGRLTAVAALLSSVPILAAVALAGAAGAQEIALGVEFQVNTYTTGSQRFPSVAVDDDGDFVVAWQSFFQDDGSFAGVFAQRFSSTGAPLAAEFQVNSYTTNSQSDPSVAADSDGDFVVVWVSTAQDGDSGGIFARRFSSEGSPLAAEFQVNTYTSSTQSAPAVAADADGDFVVAWDSALQDGSGIGVFARRFSSDGAPVGTEFQVPTYTSSSQQSSSVAASAEGDFVVIWQSFQDGDLGGVFGRRFSSAGASLATEFQVNTYTQDSQTVPSVAADADGGFAVAWGSAAQDGSGSGVFARRFSSAGVPLAAELQVNTHTTSNQEFPSVAASASGGFVVTWRSYLQDGSEFGVFGRRFSSAGAPLATEFQANTYTSSSQVFPSVAASATGDFVVAWESFGQDGESLGVFAQRFAPPKVLDIDADGTTAPLTDGLLILRYLFGFSGEALVTSAVGSGCGRCDASAIEAYLASLV